MCTKLYVQVHSRYNSRTNDPIQHVQIDDTVHERRHGMVCSSAHQQHIEFDFFFNIISICARIRAEHAAQLSHRQTSHMTLSFTSYRTHSNFTYPEAFPPRVSKRYGTPCKSIGRVLHSFILLERCTIRYVTYVSYMYI